MASNGLRDQALAEKVSESVIWVRFGFVFEGRAIVFNNLLASFVQITSFFLLSAFGACLARETLAAPLSGRQPPSLSRALARGTP